MYYALNEANQETLDKVFAMAVGAANATTGAIKGNNKKPAYSYSSIAKAASALVAVFPILTSRTVSPETAQSVSKFIEQKACSLFTLALQQANISNAESGVEYLKQFHQNLGVGGNDVNTVIKTMDAWIDAYKDGKSFAESSVSLSKINEMESDGYYDYLFEADDIEISSMDLKRVMEAMAALDSIEVYDTQLNPMSINDFVVKEFADGTYHVSIRDYSAVNEARAVGLRKPYSDYVKSGAMTRDEAIQAQADDDAEEEHNYQQTRRNRETSDRDRENARYTSKERERQARQSKEDKEHEIDRYRQQRNWIQSQEDRTAQREREAKRDIEHDEDREYIKSQREDEAAARRVGGRNVSILKDQDIKKMNDAIPSLLVVKFYRSDSASVATEFVIGVKSKMIPVTTTEVLRRIMNDNKDGKKFINFMRAITGEISKSEFMLGMSRIKDDVKSCRVKGAYGDTWNLLKNRADAAREQIKHGKHNDFSAITTVLISQADADELFREENFDITDPKNALHFMNSYNLMAFGIADDSTESLKMLFDDDSRMFEEISYTMLERETKDGTYKKLINLMAASK